MKGKKIIHLLGELILLLGVSATLIVAGVLVFSHNNVDTVESAKLVELESEPEEIIEIETDELNSTYALLVEAESGRVIFDQRGSETMYPASMTKVMTALVVIEALDDLNELFYLDPDMFADLNAQNAAMAGFAPGDSIPAIDLLYGIMLPSGAESAVGLARGVAGSEENFVELMNQKADEIGMTGTHFTNSIGLHSSNHYSTAEDMVKLVRYALDNEVFRELFTSSTYTTSSGIWLESTMFSNLPTVTVENGMIIGGKTGFTTEAGRCLVSLATINGEDYILVTAEAENTLENQIQHLLDALYIYNQL